MANKLFYAHYKNKMVIFQLILKFVVSLAVNPYCIYEFEQIILSSVNPTIPAEYVQMQLMSGLSQNDLGNYEDCEKLENATYALLVQAAGPFFFRGICGPSSCEPEDYMDYIIPVFFEQQSPYSNNTGYLAAVLPKSYQAEHYATYEAGAIIMLILIELLTVWAVLATLFDYFADAPLKESGIGKFMIAFSVISNGKRLLTTRSQERLGKKDSLELLDGVRVFSIGWVILGHCVLNYYITAPLVNPYAVPGFFEDTNAILVYGAFYAVDTFFWLSGFLMTYLFIIEVEKTATFSPVKFVLVYVHRFLRITPVYMFCIGLFWALEIHMGSGPLWVHVDELVGDCSKYWYSNLLYVNNFVPDWKSSSCLGVSWYLADDMQFFIISPIIILLYIKINKVIGWLSVFLLCCLNILTAAYVAYHFNLSPARLAAQNGDPYFDYYYNKPYTRVAPYALGIACGFIVYTYRKYKKDESVYDGIALFIAKSQENVIVRLITSFFGFALINVIIFVQYQDYKHPGSDYRYDRWSHTANYTFIALERFAYGLGLSCLLLPMLLGYFWPIASFLSIYPWNILARLNFAIYLIHFSIQQIALRSSKQSLFFGEYNIIRDTIYFYILSVFFAIPIVLLVEMPSGNLEKLLFARTPVSDLKFTEKLMKSNDKSMELGSYR